MINTDPDRLYELVPVVYRLRDADRGYPLRALLRVIAEQATLIEADIARLYDNWFIETCDDWAVAYIGTLIGYTPVATTAAPAPAARAARRQPILTPRREVANTLRYRRRKGTLALLEELAVAVSGWPAHAQEFYRRLAVTQNVRYLQPGRGRFADLRDGEALDAVATPFDRIARGVDVRRANSAHAPGAANIPDVGVFVWWLRAYTITRAPAFCDERDVPSDRCLSFSPLGNDTPLFVHPQTSGDRPSLPIAIPRRAFKRHLADYYGPGRSVLIETGAPLAPVKPEQIVAADLSDWGWRGPAGKIAVDPELGRLMLPAGEAHPEPILVSYAYGFSDDLGGGEYRRTLSQPADARLYRVGRDQLLTRIGEALAAWKADAPAHAVIEIVDSGVYAEPVALSLARGQSLQLRAADRTRPLIRLPELRSSAPDDLAVRGEPESWFTLDGVVVAGRGMRIEGDIAGVTIRHATLVPGWDLGCDCAPKRPGRASLHVTGAPLCLTIDHSILGPIQVERDEVAEDPLTLRVSDSILDAGGGAAIAIGAQGKMCAFTRLAIARSTVFGRIESHMINVIEDSILLGGLVVCRRQGGCARFCYVGPGSRTPRRFHCQPDLVEQAVIDRFVAGEIDGAARDAWLAAERLRVLPEFDSTRYGDAAYARLAATCAREITAGAEDRAEIGVFHDLYQPQREANLRQRLDEYTPAGANAGIFHAS